MLTKSHRFHGRGSVQRAYQRGQSVRSPYLSLRCSLRPANRPYRVAVVVSRKVHKSAVLRNRVRRRLYEAVRLQASLVPANYDLIFTVHSDQLVALEPQQLQAAVTDLLKKVPAAGR